MPKISVIVPIYNAGKYLTQCLDSIVNQTLKDIEIILVDDGSTDNSAEICAGYLSDPRVSYFYKENEGLAAARQDGMDRAHGEYIGFVDSDDYIDEDMYEKMFAAALSNDSDVVLCNAYEYDDKKRKMPIAPGPYDRQQIIDEIIPKTIISIDEKGQRSNIRWSNWLRIYKLSSIKENGISFPRGFRRCQDLPFTFDCMLVADNFFYLDEFLYHNRQDAGSLSRGYTKNMWSLIRPLILYIISRCEAYPQLNLSEKSASTAFFLSIDCILNEFKPDAPGGKDAVNHIAEIINDETCRASLEGIRPETLNSYYRKIFYNNIISGNARRLIKDYNYHYSKRREIDLKIMDLLTENKLYKAIRSK